MSETKRRCAKVMHGQYRGYGGSRCMRAGVVEEGGKWWCKQHAPSAVKARRDASNARYSEETRRMMAAHHRAAVIKEATQNLIEAARLAARQQGSWDAVADAVARLDEAEKSA